MSLYAIHLLRCNPQMALYQYFMKVNPAPMHIFPFVDQILNLPIEDLETGNILYLPDGAAMNAGKEERLHHMQYHRFAYCIVSCNISNICTNLQTDNLLFEFFEEISSMTFVRTYTYQIS